MKINWFPGHMTSALRMMAEEVKKVDVVLYVLDARAPLSCLNPKFCEVIGEKPILYVINKYDLADERKFVELMKFFSTEKTEAIKLVSTTSGAKNLIVNKIKEFSMKKILKEKRKGLNAHLRAMVIGVPNCGKSSLINNLCNVSKAITGDKPGVTKGKQWVNIGGGIEVLDTPGTLWPDLKEQTLASNLAYIGSIKDEILDLGELALSLIATLNIQYPTYIADRYNIDAQCEDVLGEIAMSRKFMARGGEPDYERAARAVLDDFRKGRLGKVTLDEI